MKYNYLDRIPPDIGRMCNLEFLALTNNKLQNKSLPYSLTFCSRLHTLMLDNNLLDALPGFLLAMPSLNTVYRHGNHNYFKSTFMWYHTDVTDRILRTSAAGGSGAGRDFVAREPERLQFWAARAVIATKRNFFSDPAVPPPLRDYIADIYTLFNVCGHCHTAQLASRPGEYNIAAHPHYIDFILCLNSLK
jgi:Leucine-rich repeat (LRR) protein